MHWLGGDGFMVTIKSRMENLPYYIPGQFLYKNNIYIYQRTKVYQFFNPVVDFRGNDYVKGSTMDDDGKNSKCVIKKGYQRVHVSFQYTSH